MSLSLTEMLFSMKQIPVSQQLDGREPGFASQTRGDLSWGDLALSLVLVAAPMARVSRIPKSTRGYTRVRNKPQTVSCIEFELPHVLQILLHPPQQKGVK